MTSTQQKLMYTQIMLEQAKKSINDYPIFLANLDAFITNARSVTFVMQSEFSSIEGFREWYRAKLKDMKKEIDMNFFNKLRVDSTHIRTFKTTSKYTTSFPGGLTITGADTVNIPLGKGELGY